MPAALFQLPQRTKINLEILIRQAERRLELIHATAQLEKRQTEPLDLVLAQRAAVHATNGLMLQDFPKQFYHRQHETRKALLDTLRVSVDTVGQASRDGVQRGGSLVGRGVLRFVFPLSFLAHGSARQNRAAGAARPAGQLLS